MSVAIVTTAVSSTVTPLTAMALPGCWVMTQATGALHPQQLQQRADRQQQRRLHHVRDCSGQHPQLQQRLQPAAWAVQRRLEPGITRRTGQPEPALPAGRRYRGDWNNRLSGLRTVCQDNTPRWSSSTMHRRSPTRLPPLRRGRSGYSVGRGWHAGDRASSAVDTVAGMLPPSWRTPGRSDSEATSSPGSPGVPGAAPSRVRAARYATGSVLSLSGGNGTNRAIDGRHQRHRDPHPINQGQQ